MPDDPCHAVATLRLGAWSAVAHRTLPRLVPLRRAGPLARPVPVGSRPDDPALLPHPRRAGPPRPAMAWDLAIDLPGGIARVDRALLRAWGQAADRVWVRALANLGRRPGLQVGSWCGSRSHDRAGEPRVRILTEGPWTTGWLLLATEPERHRRHRATDFDIGTRAVAVVVHPGLVIVADRPRPGGGSPGPSESTTGDLAIALWPVAERLARAEGRDPAGLTTLVRREAPFPDQWILE